MIENQEVINYLPKFLEQTKNGVVVTDPNQKNNPIVYVNKATCDIFGYNKEDFLGKNCKFLQRGYTKQPEIKKISRAIKQRQPILTTVKNFTKEGKLVYNQLSISPIYDEYGELKFFLGVQRDATKENLLQLKNQELQQKEIDNTKFNTIGRLSAGLSHELNTPLTVIRGTLEMMGLTIQEQTDGSFKNYLLEDLQIVDQEFKKLGNIVESLREIADTQVFEKKEINLYRTLIFSLRLMYHKIKLSGSVFIQGDEFNLDLDRDQESYNILADSNRLEQLWIILIENALDQFIKKGFDTKEAKLWIEIEEKENSIELFFKDNGGGFEQEVLQNIFIPFNTTTEHKGLGVGLIVAKQIVDKHMFDITISNSEYGATVQVTIPIDRSKGD